MTAFLSNREIYERVVCGIVPHAMERLWIATADIKGRRPDQQLARLFSTVVLSVAEKTRRPAP